MKSSREGRLVENETLFRAANERLHERAQDLVPDGEQVPFLCECTDDTCMARIDLTLAEYERVRADDYQFVILPGHPQLDSERVVHEDGRYLIVTKEDVR